MLQKLSISNFVLIDHIEIDFQNGLSVITGETGAGKSILLGALNLILGNRSDHSALKNKEKKCIIEGVFNIKDYEMKSFFEKNDLDYEEVTILRREIHPNGKSRNFINDTPTKLENMRSLGMSLIDIHSQHQSHRINDSVFQLHVIDSLAGTQEIVKTYKKEYVLFNELTDKISSLEEKIANAKKQEDYLNFQFEELSVLNLVEGEGNQLEAEQNKFANSEDIIRNLNNLVSLLGEQEGNVEEQLRGAKNLLDQTIKFDVSFQELGARVNSILIELIDIKNDLEQKTSDFHYDAERHSYVEERLNELNRLLQKHQVNNSDELFQIKEQIENKLMNIGSFEEELKMLKKQREAIQSSLDETGNELTGKRKSILRKFEDDVQSILKELGITSSQFIVDHKQLDTFQKTGKDEFSFLFSANKGIPPEKVMKSASGGEISRLMLSIKKILADHTQLPTILFDEIDTGVSGETAEKVGSILKEMSRSRQVISITHLPQLAAKGEQHLFVYKLVEKGKSHTQIKELKQEERVEELAKMLSGAKISTAAINNAKELLTQ